MKRILWLGAIAVALLGVQGTAVADWFDNFDTYNVGPLVPQGGWEVWAAGADTNVTIAQSLSGPNSVEIIPTADVVHQYAGYSSGRWSYIAWQYVPSTHTGLTYFILLNTYAYPSGPYFWSVQVTFDGGSGNLVGDCGASDNVTMAYNQDQWTKIQVNVDLDEDWTQIYYDGNLLDGTNVADHPVYGGGYAWSKGVFGGDNGALDIAAVDLFGNNAAPVYYDDMRLVPTALIPDVYEITATSGGTVDFDLDASPYHAGKNYFLLGSVTGTSPGTPMPGGGVLPLNWDVFTGLIFKLGMANSPATKDFKGVLDASGRAQAQLNTFGPLPPVAVGLVMYFAYTTYAPFDFQSNAVAVTVK